MLDRQKLAILATFLERKADQDKFAMATFATDHEEGEDLEPNEFSQAKLNECGTTACAMGHAALIFPPIASDRWWCDYSKRVFGETSDSPEWMWCFAGQWSAADNTPGGAAKRIRRLIERGLPDDWEEQMHRRNYEFAN